ncbi:MAG: GDSL lipase/esterase [Benniella sp.]|nr:MAG: GDSL lipase/esterase [Benniella sp.]
MVIFGDSFSDSGNVFRLTNGAWPVSERYPDGQFSNGHVWAGWVAKDTTLNMSNFALGGATTDSTVVQGYTGPKVDIPVRGFIQQIEELYLPNRPPLDDATKDSTLFVVCFEGNDFLFDANISTETVLANIERGIHRLVEVGAKHILVVGDYDIGRLPFCRKDKALAEQTSALTRKQRDEYQDLVRRLSHQYGQPAGKGCRPFHGCGVGVNLVYFDLLEFIKELHEPQHLERMGIVDNTHSFLSGDGMAECSDPEGYFFYDDYHLNTKVHRQVANGILAFL